MIEDHETSDLSPSQEMLAILDATGAISWGIMLKIIRNSNIGQKLPW